MLVSRSTSARLLLLSLSCAGPLTLAHRADQSPMAIPQDVTPAVATESQPLLLADTLGTQRSLSIFASLARDDMNTSAQLADKAGYMVVLAPTNAALKEMGHKPWEDADPRERQAVAATGRETGTDQAQRNIRRFVQGCLVGGGSSDGDREREEWAEGEKRQRGEGGKEVWWEVKEGKRVVMPEGIKVEGIVSKVVNGEVWALDGTLKP